MVIQYVIVVGAEYLGTVAVIGPFASAGGAAEFLQRHSEMEAHFALRVMPLHYAVGAVAEDDNGD